VWSRAAKSHVQQPLARWLQGGPAPTRQDQARQPVEAPAKVPIRAPAPKERVRQAIRAELSRYNSVQTLESGVAVARDSITHSPRRAGRLARVLRRGSNLRDPQTPSTLWQSHLQQILGQEVQQRRNELASEVNRTLDNIATVPSTPSAGADKPPGSPKNATNFGKAGIMPFAPENALLQDIKSAPKWRNSEKEKVWHTTWQTAFQKIVKSGRIKRDDIPHAMELAGFRRVSKDLVELLYETITLSRTMAPDEFHSLCRAYEVQQRKACNEAFRAQDKDHSGAIEAAELADVLKRFGMEPMKHVIEDVLAAVDTDRSGVITIDEFENLIELLDTGEGFTELERTALRDIFDRYDTNNDGIILTEGLAGTLGWLGYRMTQEEVKTVASEVDVDSSGNFDYREFLMCMRKVRELEIVNLKQAILAYDADGSNTIDINELQPMMRSLGYFPTLEAVVETTEDAGVDLDLDLDELFDFMQLYRAREGLTRAEHKEVDDVFRRYASERDHEMSTSDIGRAIRCYGFAIAYEHQQQLANQVDIDVSGRLNVSEFRKLIRMFIEEDLKKMSDTFRSFLQDGNKVLDEESVVRALDKLGFIKAAELGSLPEEMSTAGGIDMDGFLRICSTRNRILREEFKERGGFNDAEVKNLRNLFNKYDADKSGTISFVELGCLIRNLFPVMDDGVRPKLDRLMREVDSHNSKIGLDFEDFIRMMRQFHDLQSEQKVEMEKSAALEAGFTQNEVAEFRELFLASDNDRDDELTLSDVMRLMETICPLGDRNIAELTSAFHVARKRPAKQTGMDTMNFPDFLRFMRHLLDINFGHIKERLEAAANAAPACA